MGSKSAWITVGAHSAFVLVLALIVANNFYVSSDYHDCRLWGVLAFIDLPAALALSSFGCVFYSQEFEAGDISYRIYNQAVVFMLLGGLQWYAIARYLTVNGIRSVYRVSLRTLLVIFVTLSILIALRASSGQVHDRAFLVLKRNGAKMWDTWMDPPGPNWLYTGRIFSNFLPPNGYFSTDFEHWFCIQGTWNCYFDEKVEFSMLHLEAVKDLLHLSNLTIDKTNLCGSSIEEFGHIRGLVSLSIGESNIADEDFVHFATLTNLRWLSLSGDFSPDVIADLKLLLPDCEVKIVSEQGLNY